MQRTALRAAADAERYADQAAGKSRTSRPGAWLRLMAARRGPTRPDGSCSTDRPCAWHSTPLNCRAGASDHGRLSSKEGRVKIGIIGAGMIGGTLARRLVNLGHEVVIANSRGPDTIRELAADVGATAVTVAEAARRGEIVIVTIPQRAVADLPKDL